MICPKCGSTQTAELAEWWSAWGLHRLGIANPEVRIKVYCRTCGFSASDCAAGASDPANGENIHETVKRVERAFSEGNTKKPGNTISWDDAIKRFPEIQAYYDGRPPMGLNGPCIASKCADELFLR